MPLLCLRPDKPRTPRIIKPQRAGRHNQLPDPTVEKICHLSSGLKTKAKDLVHPNQAQESLEPFIEEPTNPQKPDQP